MGVLVVIAIIILGYKYLYEPYEEGLKGKTVSQKKKPFYKQAYSESPEVKGNHFEEFIVKKFDKRYYKLLDWRSDKYIDGRYAESNFYPDLVYEFKLNGFSTQFAIECKYRSSLYDQQFLEEERKIENYRHFEKEKGMPVYIALGVGGIASNPDELFLFRLYGLEGNAISYKRLKSYQRPPEKQFFYNIETKTLK